MNGITTSRFAAPTVAADLSAPGRTSAAHREVEVKLRPSERLADSVELSQRAMYLDRLRGLPAIRTDIVEEVREAIAHGEYSIEDKLGIAIERLMEDLEV